MSKKTKKEAEETNRIVFISYPNDPQQINNCTMRISYPTDPQQIDNYPCKVNVADNHDVEVTEEFQFLEVDGSLSVALRGFLQVTNGPGREREKK